MRDAEDVVISLKENLGREEREAVGSWGHSCSWGRRKGPGDGCGPGWTTMERELVPLDCLVKNG